MTRQRKDILLAGVFVCLGCLPNVSIYPLCFGIATCYALLAITHANK